MIETKPAPSPIVEFRGVSKFFGQVSANKEISFQIQEGEICALLGENGAGKSTLMKILFGLEKPSEGEVLIRGERVDIVDPEAAHQQKIGMVHQHFMLAGPMTALDHVVLEQKSESLWRPLNRKKILHALEDLSARLQMPLPWEDPVESLPVGLQQRLEILKLLYLENEILIFDEPTAVLTPQEVEEFLKRLLDLKQKGKTIVLITHKLREVLAVADKVVVLRHGQVVAQGPRSQWNLQNLSEAMIGQSLKHSEFQQRPQAFLGVKQVILENILGRINFAIEKGEVIGIAGVEGNGQTELIEALLHPNGVKGLQGKCLLRTPQATKNLLALSNLEIRQLGVGYLSEDRHKKSVLLRSNLLENFLLGLQDLFSENGVLLIKKLQDALKEAVDRFDIKIGKTSDTMLSLSGGNQQKLVVARELTRPLNFLVAAQPTRGVDIGAIEKIHRALWDLRKKGTSILLVSSELEELMKLSDRILVMFKGEILGEFSRDQFDEKKIGAVMGGCAQ